MRPTEETILSMLVHSNTFFRVYLSSADSLLSGLQVNMKLRSLPQGDYTLSLDVNVIFVLE